MRRGRLYTVVGCFLGGKHGVWKPLGVSSAKIWIFDRVLRVLIGARPETSVVSFVDLPDNTRNRRLARAAN